MTTPWQKYMDELLDDIQNRRNKRFQEKRMMSYLQELLPEANKIEGRKTRRVARVLKR